MPNRRPQLSIVAPSASPEEAAAIVAALEQFLADTAPPATSDRKPVSGWQRAGLEEGVSARHLGGYVWGHSPPR